ncbi:immunoglobulin-like domain-containing protein, partial [Acinetobacter johnsonii]|uniref:immunoglobulin-like domain-containing protein n=1 Tax=Acinetobacter johnsonii TaxID=40214 RepID=UPI003AF9BBEB
MNTPNGIVNIDAQGTITFTPNTGFSGQETFNYSISDGQGGSSTANQIINIAPVETTTLTLTAAAVNEGADITITATVDNAPEDTDLVITLDNGQIITIAVGATTGSVTFANPNGEDVYLDGETLVFDVNSAVGGNYENLVSPADVSVVVNDTINPTTVTLNNVSVDEGTGTATIGASLDHAPTAGPVVLTLSNGSTVTFNVGYTPGDIVQSTPFAVQGDDVYRDGES